MGDGRTRGYISTTYPTIDILVVDARTSTSLSTTFNTLSPLPHDLHSCHRRTSSLLSKYRIRRNRRNTRTASTSTEIAGNIACYDKLYRNSQYPLVNSGKEWRAIRLSRPYRKKLVADVDVRRCREHEKRNLNQLSGQGRRQLQVELCVFIENRAMSEGAFWRHISVTHWLFQTTVPRGLHWTTTIRSLAHV